MSEKVVSENSRVVLHFNIKLKDGSAADSTRVNGNPAILKLGSGQVSKAFEEHIMGLKEGDKNNFILSAEDSAGQPNPDNIITIPCSNVPDNINLEQGMILSFPQSNGIEIPGVVREFTEKDVTVDFNHPLAGHELKFEVEIIEILDEKA